MKELSKKHIKSFLLLLLLFIFSTSTTTTTCWALNMWTRTFCMFRLYFIQMSNCEVDIVFNPHFYKWGNSGSEREGNCSKYHRLQWNQDINLVCLTPEFIFLKLWWLQPLPFLRKLPQLFSMWKISRKLYKYLSISLYCLQSWFNIMFLKIAQVAQN